MYDKLSTNVNRGIIPIWFTEVRGGATCAFSFVEIVSPPALAGIDPVQPQTVVRGQRAGMLVLLENLG
jgi:hypothetical protein